MHTAANSSSDHFNVQTEASEPSWSQLGAAATLAPSCVSIQVTRLHTVMRKQHTCWALVTSSEGKKKPCAVFTVLHVEAEGEAGSEKPSKPLHKLTLFSGPETLLPCADRRPA